MCNEHEHHIEYSTDDYPRLCFKHAILEALKDKYVETEVVPEYKVTDNYRDCELCETELMAQKDRDDKK
jgi:hypothetical protein